MIMLVIVAVLIFGGLPILLFDSAEEAKRIFREKNPNSSIEELEKADKKIDDFLIKIGIIIMVSFVILVLIVALF